MLSAEILRSLLCPGCRSGAPKTTDGNALECERCRTRYPFAGGYLDLSPDYQEHITPIQHVLQFKPAILLYDNVWRPFGYFLTSDRSFSRDLKRITELMAPERHRLVLDLACGPGNFTRSIARVGERTQVIGFDLARQMLERARALTPEEEFPNVAYMRGSALSLPFEPEVFDAVICCGALQLFTNYDRSLSEISRVLKAGGDFVCQTVVGAKPTPMWLRLADRIGRYGHFKIDELKSQLQGLSLDIVDEELSRASYIFRAAKVS
jgi:SAM-dependent methyltransferase